MKRQRITQISRIILALLFAPLLTTACGGGDSDDQPEPSPTPTPGPTPVGPSDNGASIINLEPSINGMTTRGTIDGHWLADGTENVAVQIYDVVKTYVVNGKRTMVSDNPFTWEDSNLEEYKETNESSVAVAAWYPYTSALSATRTVSTDQANDGLDSSDFMYASANIGYQGQGTWVYPITFYHQVSKLVITVTSDVPNEARTVTDIQIVNTCPSGTFTAPVSGNHGTWSTSGVAANIAVQAPVAPSTGWNTAWNVITIPQTVAKGTDFIVITLSDASTLTYKPTQEAGFTMAAGMVHNCNFTIKGHTLSLTTTITDWTDVPLDDPDPGEWTEE